MAGDWIKMRSDLHTHPKVVRISSALHADRLRVIGGLHAVWCLFDAHSEDGSLDGYSLDAIDELICWAGFATALQAVGWLVFANDSVSLPRFDEHNGRSAKRRVMETERKRRERFANSAEKSSASEADTKRTREEKIREETSSLRSEVERASPSHGSRLPSDWKLPDDWASWAKTQRPDLNPVDIADKFADYWHSVAGAKGRRADWQATWRNWVRSEKFADAQVKAGRALHKFDPTSITSGVRIDCPVTVIEQDGTVLDNFGPLPY